MKDKLLYSKTSPFQTIFLLITFLFFSVNQAYSLDTNCGEIESLTFSNGDSNMTINDDATYNLDELPNNFYINVNVEGNAQSVRYIVKNLDTYQIHTIIENYEPYTFPAGNQAWNLGTGTFRVKAKLYKYNYGWGTPCDLQTITFTITDSCSAFAGTLTADSNPVSLVDGQATISATANGDINIPDGYSSVFVLTQGEGLVIVNAGAEPSFPVTESGLYTIHTLVYNPDTLDLGIVELGVTTGVDVYGLITEGGGEICASLDVAGAPIMVESCEADAGSLTADAMTVCYEEGAMISATPNGDINVPDGYSSVYVLTQGEGLVIVNAGAEPSFPVTEAGMYTIHTLVYNPDTLDLGIVELGVTTGVDVYGLLIDGGGEICASLDVAGAPVTVEDPNAGTLTADSSPVSLVEGQATISATANGDINIPDGYSSVYVLTQGEGLVIVNAGAEPSFPVTEAGMYTIHTLVYNPDTLDLGIVELGVTTGVDVFGLITEGGGEICASLDVTGAPFMVDEDENCEAYSGTLTSENIISCLDGGLSTIMANEYESPIIPDGYQQLYVLTNAFDLTILDVSTTPEFDVSHVGFYRIHSLVYNSDTLDLDIVQIGQTTGFDVNGLLIQGGGEICASLDVQGAVFLVLPSWICNWFNYNNGRINQVELLEGYISQFDDYQGFEASLLKQAEPKLYPNPVKDVLNVDIRLLDNEQMSYIISDVSGRQVQAGSVDSIINRGNTIDMSSLSNGMYIMQFKSEYREVVSKIQVSN